MVASQKKTEEDPHGHLWTDKDTPTLDDEGDYTSYAKCSRCGAVENTDESIKDCDPKNRRLI